MLTRRNLLKGAGLGALACFFPRLVHSATGVSTKSHPTWDALIDQVGFGFGDRRPDLMQWIHDLVHRPNLPQAAILLNGPTTMFPEAMELLLPAESVVRVPDYHEMRYEYRMERGVLSEVREIGGWTKLDLRNPRLIVVNEIPIPHIAKLLGFQKQDRRMKWCLTSTKGLGYGGIYLFSTIMHFPIKAHQVDEGFIRRLKDEREAFQFTLSRMPKPRPPIVDSSMFSAHGRLDLNPELYKRNKYRLFAELYGGKRKTILRSHHV